MAQLMNVHKMFLKCHVSPHIETICKTNTRANIYMYVYKYIYIYISVNHIYIHIYVSVFCWVAAFLCTRGRAGGDTFTWDAGRVLSGKSRVFFWPQTLQGVVEGWKSAACR